MKHCDWCQVTGCLWGSDPVALMTPRCAIRFFFLETRRVNAIDACREFEAMQIRFSVFNDSLQTSSERYLACHLRPLRLRMPVYSHH